MRTKKMIEKKEKPVRYCHSCRSEPLPKRKRFCPECKIMRTRRLRAKRYFDNKWKQVAAKNKLAPLVKE